MAHTGSCDVCGAHGQIEFVELSTNTGMLILRQSSTLAGNVCKRCGKAAFTKATLHNLVFGWWGIISFFVNFYYLLSNTVYFVKLLQLPDADIGLHNRLSEYSEYATNLLATKDEEIVIEVLMKEAGATRAEVVGFIGQLR